VAADVIQRRHWSHIKHLPLTGFGPSSRIGWTHQLNACGGGGGIGRSDRQQACHGKPRYSSKQAAAGEGKHAD
jgi:hypothetical protein